MIRQTSIDAYETIKANGLLSRRRFMTYEILYVYGPMTGNQIASKAIEIYRDGTKRHNYASRCGELRDMGVLQEVSETKCPVSGMNVILWDVTAALPRKLQKSEIKMTRKELEKRYANCRAALLAIWNDPNTQHWTKEIIRKHTQRGNVNEKS